jgi:hypothetical protein
MYDLWRRFFGFPAVGPAISEFQECLNARIQRGNSRHRSKSRIMTEKKTPLNILVIGPTGHGGSYLCVELCNRGHHVTGLSRNPSTIGEHENYTPKTFDVSKSTFTELRQALEGYDVVIKYPLSIPF